MTAQVRPSLPSRSTGLLPTGCSPFSRKRERLSIWDNRYVSTNSHTTDQPYTVLRLVYTVVLIWLQTCDFVSTVLRHAPLLEPALVLALHE